MSHRRLASAAIALILITGCAGGSDGADSSSDTTLGTTTEPIDTTRAPEPTAPEPPISDESTSTTSTTTAEGVIPETAVITLLTGGSGLGPRPLLQWEPVESAVTYVVSVNAPTGGPLWTWQGAATEVPFGGGPADDPDTTGAQLTSPATWFVAAIDTAGRVMATSPEAELTP